MHASIPERVKEALERHEAFEYPARPSWKPFADERAATLRTTHFEAAVTATETDDGPPEYVVAVRVPMLSAATRDAVGPAVEEGWVETLELRLADAPMATREDLHLESFSLQTDAVRAVARFTYTFADPDRAVSIAKTLAEYVEGAYVEGIVPGYEYDEPVASLLARAGDGDGERGKGPTPL